ncbi:MAG: hypothetical protein ACRDJM_01855 [Actinomycetota bacterium]
MRRLLIAIVLAALGPMPAGAATVSGSVMLPSFGTPSIARYLSQTGEEVFQGLTGYVFALPAWNVPFTLRRISGATGLEDFDLFFYQSLDGLTGQTAGPAMCTTSNPVCQGNVPFNARFAIVTLSLGLAGTFTYSNP